MPDCLAYNNHVFVCALCPSVCCYMRVSQWRAILTWQSTKQVHFFYLNLIAACGNSCMCVCTAHTQPLEMHRVCSAQFWAHFLSVIHNDSRCPENKTNKRGYHRSARVSETHIQMHTGHFVHHSQYADRFNFDSFNYFPFSDSILRLAVMAWRHASWCGGVCCRGCQEQNMNGMRPNTKGRNGDMMRKTTATATMTMFSDIQFYL